MRSLEDRIRLSWLLHEPTINHQPAPQSPFAAVGPPLAPLPSPLDNWDLFPATPVQPSPLHATRQRSASLPDVLAFDRMGASPWSLATLHAPRPITLPGSPTTAHASQQHNTYASTMHHMLETLTPCEATLPSMGPVPHLGAAPQASTAALDELLAKLVALRLQGTQGGVLQPQQPHPANAMLQALDAAACAPGQAAAKAVPSHCDTPILDGLPKYAKTVLYKTEPCRGWEAAGSCRYGVRCQFAHGPHELRPVPRQKHKTQVVRD